MHSLLRFRRWVLFRWLILPFEVFTICLHCQDTSDSSRPSVGRCHQNLKCQIPLETLVFAAQIRVKSEVSSENLKTLHAFDSFFGGEIVYISDYILDFNLDLDLQPTWNCNLICWPDDFVAPSTTGNPRVLRGNRHVKTERSRIMAESGAHVGNSVRLNCLLKSICIH